MPRISSDLAVHSYLRDLHSSLTFRLNLPEVFLSIMDSTPQELLLIYSSITASFSHKDDINSLELVLEALRIDNQLAEVTYRYVLRHWVYGVLI